jgi:uncharacterized protein YndB with AHSA1/START domain
VEPDRADVRRADDPGAPHGLQLARLIDLPRVIVWDALVDPVLLSGWLGDADVDLREGGRFRLHPGAPDGRRPTGLRKGRIVAITPPEGLEIRSDVDAAGVASRLRFRLGDVPGGPRDRSTALTVTLSSTTPLAHPAETRATWLTHLDLLRELLHGRPVDWDRWAFDWEPVWQTNLGGPHPREGAERVR